MHLLFTIPSSFPFSLHWSLLKYTLLLTYLFTYSVFIFVFHSIQWLNAHRYSVQEKILRNRNEEDRYSIRSTTKLNANEFYDPNQNKYYKVNGNIVTVKPTMPSSPMHHNGINGGVSNIDSNGHHHHHHHNHIINNGNGNANNANKGGSGGGIGNNNGNVVAAPAAIIRERYQHPALVAIINEAQGIKFRGESWVCLHWWASGSTFIPHVFHNCGSKSLVNRKKKFTYWCCQYVRR